MPLFVVKARGAGGGVIGGGSQSARNLLEGMRELGQDAPCVQWQVGEPKIQTNSSGSIELTLPPLTSWKDPACVELLAKFLESYPVGELIHLVEVESYLGCWIEALGRTKLKVVVTALDYAWLCETSRLLTKRLQRCEGPTSFEGCHSCYFDHRNPGPRLALKTLAAVSHLPGAQRIGRLAWIRRTQEMMAGRLAALAEDFSAVDALIAPSLALGEAFVQNGFPRDKMFHVPYGTAAASPIPLAERPPLADGVVLGFVGRATFDKGFDVLVRALAGLRAAGVSGFSLKVFTAADPRQWDADVRKIVAAAEGKWLSFGQFDGASPPGIDAAHATMHLLVAPSRWTDNLPNAVLEAFQRTTPVIAPRMGSFVEMIVEGDNGWFFDADDPESLPLLLRKVVDRPQSYCALPFAIPRTRARRDEAQAVLDVYYQILQPSEV